MLESVRRSHNVQSELFAAGVLYLRAGCYPASLSSAHAGTPSHLDGKALLAQVKLPKRPVVSSNWSVCLNQSIHVDLWRGLL